MNLKPIVLVTMLAAFAATSAFANEEPKTEAVKTEKAAAKKPVKKHSHSQEKTGIPASEPVAAAEKHEHTNKHDHTKDKH